MGIIFPLLGHNISTKSLLFALGKPKKNPRKTQKKAKKTAGEIQGNQLDFKIASVC